MNKIISALIIVSLVQVTSAILENCKTVADENKADNDISGFFNSDTTAPIAHRDGCHYKIKKKIANHVGVSIVRCLKEHNTLEWAAEGSSPDGNWYNDEHSYVEDNIPERSCEIDSKYIYVKKTFYDVSKDLCPTAVTVMGPNDKPFDATIVSITKDTPLKALQDLVFIWPKLPELKGNFEYEYPRGLGGAGKSQVALVRIRKTNFVPHFLILNLVKIKDEKVKFHACINYGDHYYYTRYYTDKYAYTQAIKEAFQKKSEADRIKGYVEMATLAKKFVDDYGWIDHAFGPSSFQYDDNNLLFIRPSCDVLAKGDISYAKRWINTSWRFKSDEQFYRKTEYDMIYIMAMSIVSGEWKGDGGKVWGKYWSQEKEFPKDVFPVENLTDTEQKVNTIVKGVLTPVWGDADKATNPHTPKSLTSLILWILNHADSSYTLEKFINDLKVCEKKKNLRLLSLD